MIFLSSADIFQNILSGMPSECQTVWIQIRTNILLGLIWVQTVGKDHHEMIKMLLADKELTTIHNLGCLVLYFWKSVDLEQSHLDPYCLHAG